MDIQSVIIPVVLEDGSVINVEATPIGEQDIALPTLSFKDIKSSIAKISQELAETIQRVKPDKASVKFGLEVVVKEGVLTGLLTKGSGKANLEITLEWTPSSKLVGQS